MSNRFFINASVIPGVVMLFASCSNEPKNKNHGPITLGDSTSIVTETDPVYLQDMVQDLRPLDQPASAPEEMVAKKDTLPEATAKPVEKAVPAAPAQPAGNGLSIAFKEVTVFIPNITTRSYGNQDLQKSRGATYELSSGNLAGNQLKITNGTVQKVTQRYQTAVALQYQSDRLVLESLGNYSSGWKQLSGTNSFTITGLETGKLESSMPTATAIRNAVQPSARRARLNRRKTDDWQEYAKTARSADKSPCAIVLRSVSWRIEGKDAAGKSFNKEVRIDMPR